MGQVYNIDMARGYLSLTEEPLDEFDHIFYSVADKYIFDAKKE